MMEVYLSDNIRQNVSGFKTGVAIYHDITVSDTPQMVKGRLQLEQQELMLSLEEKSVGDWPGIKEWRQVFKGLGTDPSRYRPSHEALLRRLKKGQKLPQIHSAADINNSLSTRFCVPMGIYDLDKLSGGVEIRVGTELDRYEGLNGREMSMNQKLLSADQQGAFGSPIVDSKRAMTTEATTNALHIVYLRPSTSIEQSREIMDEVKGSFAQFNGGDAEYFIVE